MHDNYTLAEFLCLQKYLELIIYKKLHILVNSIEGWLYKTTRIRIIIVLWKNCKLQTEGFLPKNPTHLHQRKQENMPVW